jgi:hypothetical protein
MAAEIDEVWVEEAIERYRRIEAMQGEFEKAASGLEVIVRSPDGLVEVLVTADGVIRDVIVVGSLSGRSNIDLSRSIQTAVSAAADAAGWARQKLRNETFSDYRPLKES